MRSRSLLIYSTRRWIDSVDNFCLTSPNNSRSVQSGLRRNLIKGLAPTIALIVNRHVSATSNTRTLFRAFLSTKSFVGSLFSRNSVADYLFVVVLVSFAGLRSLSARRYLKLQTSRKIRRALQCEHDLQLPRLRHAKDM